LSSLRDINDLQSVPGAATIDEAFHSYDSGIVIHDIASRKSVVHTDYSRLSHTTLMKERTILTHSPDMITSEWVLSRTDKLFRVIGDDFFEVVGDRLYALNVDVYHKEAGRYYVGYRNPEAPFVSASRLAVAVRQRGPGKVHSALTCTNIMKISKLDNDKDIYFERKDGLRAATFR
jgi:hypothetical protein